MFFGTEILLKTVRGCVRLDIVFYRGRRDMKKKKSMDNLENELICAYERGGLLEYIRTNYYKKQGVERSLSGAIGALHNDRYFDFLKLLCDVDKTMSSHEFYIIGEVFNDILPNLDASVDDVVQCIQHLRDVVHVTVDDYFLLDAFSKFCQKSHERVKKLWEFCGSDLNENLLFFLVAIKSGIHVNAKYYIDCAIQLLDKGSDNVQVRVISLLGDINYEEEEILEKIINTISQLVDLSSSDNLRAAGVRAMFSLTMQSRNQKSKFLEFLSMHSNYKGEKYLKSVAYILAFSRDKVTEELERKLLPICLYIKQDNIGAIDLVDHVLMSLLENQQYEKCILFLEKYFENNPDASIQTFDSLIAEVHKQEGYYLTNWLTRWLLSNNIVLQKSISELLTSNYSTNDNISVAFDTSLLVEKGNEIYFFLAKKAVGWFFEFPDIVSSLIESLILVAPEKERADITALLFDTMCINYPLAMRSRLNYWKTSNHGLLKETAGDVLSKLDEYHKKLGAAYHIRELEPSERERYAFQKYENRLMGESVEQARKQSVMYSFVSETVMLYGNKAIYDVTHVDGKKVRTVSPLHSFEYKVEIPSESYVNPLGMELKIRTFKLEGVKL